MCHGAGGFASQYFFGGRTGGAMIMENIELILIATIGIVSFFTNLAVGFFLGVLLYYAIKRLSIHQ